MNKQDLKQNIERMKLELADMEKKLEDSKKVGRWTPTKGQSHYFLLLSNGQTSCSNYYGNATNTRQYEDGNMFRTKEHAELFAKRRAARNRLELLAFELNGQEIVEFRSGLHNWMIVRDGNEVRTGLHYNTYHSEVLFKSDKLAQQALDATSNEDLEILFGTSKRG